VGEHGGEKLVRHIAREQPVAVLAEGRRIPRGLVNAQPHEPAEQEVVFQPLHDLALGADAVEGLKQQRPKQPLRRDRRSTNAGRIERLELGAQSQQRPVHNLLYRPQRMITSNPALKIHVRKQRTRTLI
jgi:hypothetical protein